MFYSFLAFWPFTVIRAIDLSRAPPELPFPSLSFAQATANPLNLFLWRAGANHALTLAALLVFGLVQLVRSRNAIQTAIDLILVDALHEGLWTLMWVVAFLQIEGHTILPSTFPIVIIGAVLLPLQARKDRSLLLWFALNCVVFLGWLSVGFPVSYSGPQLLLTNLAVNVWENVVWLLSILSYGFRRQIAAIFYGATTRAANRL